MMAIRAALEQVDGRLRPAFSLVSLEDGAVQEQILVARIFALSAMFLAGLALALASIGVYGVMAFLVSQQEKEVGIHMALGATGRDVLLLMLSQGMRPVLIGGALGVVGAFGVSGLLRALLIFPGSVDVFYGARWFDPPDVHWAFMPAGWDRTVCLLSPGTASHARGPLGGVAPRMKVALHGRYRPCRYELSPGRSIQRPCLACRVRS